MVRPLRGAATVAVAVSSVIVASLLTGTLPASAASSTHEAQSPAMAPQAVAAVSTDFDPSNIISDANFFDANAMTEAEIQAFLSAKVAGCSNGRCLDVLSVVPVGKAPDQMCTLGYGVDGGAERVSRIIFKVQQSCGVSAKAILVTLQKEQGLVTDRSPTDGELRAAMGYGCPDTAACDSTYYGIFNQLYQAARQFKRYALPGSSFTWFPVGRPTAVRYHPNASCGAGTITIQNKATAGLYYYTPYQPNAAALGNLYGTGDGCSSYGNRNFWRFYTDWFGNPTSPRGTPTGELLTVTGEVRSVRVTGWAVDPDAQTATVPVAVQIGANWFGDSANKPSTAAQTAYPDAGPNHGYDFVVPAAAGAATVCVTLVNAGGAGSNQFYSCRTVQVAAAPAPIGDLTLSDTGTAVGISGWAVRPDALTAPVTLAANIGANWYALESGKPNAVAPAQVAGAGPNQGFSGSITLPPGSYQVCIWGAPSEGPSVLIACKSVTRASPPPQGAITSLTGGAATVTISGWVARPDVPTTAVDFAVNIGANWTAVTAGSASPASPTVAGSHGFTATIAASPGSQQVCIWAAPTAGPTVQLACQTVVVGAAPVAAVGEIASVVGSVGKITFAGWAVRPEALTSSVPIAVNIGSSWYAQSTGSANSVAPTKVAGAGPNQGYSGTIDVAPGTYSVCIWATGATGAVNLGCRSVNVLSGAAIGEIATVTGVLGGISFAGWAVRPDAPTASVPIAVNVGASWYAFSTGVANAVAPTKLEGAGLNQGFAGTVTVAPGTHTACIWATGATGAVNLGCRTVSVPTNAATGEISTVTGAAGGVSFTGWAVRPEAPTAAVAVAVNIGASWYAYSTGVANAVAPTKVAGAGPNQGFSGTVPAEPGSYTACVWVSGATGAVNLGCRAVTVPSAAAATGELASVTAIPGGLSFAGWAVRPEAPTGSVAVAVNIGASWYPFATGVADSVAPVSFPGAGPNQGFAGALALAPGSHTACIWVAGSTGAVNLGCRTVTVAASPPVAGAIVTATPRAGAIDFVAWVVRPDAPTAPVPVAVNVGSSWTAFSTGAASPAAPLGVVGAGPNQGVTGSVTASRGSQTICIWAAGTSSSAVSLACATVVVP